MRPYHTAKADDKWTYNLDFRPEPGEIYFSSGEREIGETYRDRVIIEPHIKPSASPNKQWGWDRWSALCKLLMKSGVRPTQLGPQGIRLLDGADFVATPTFRVAAAILARARAAVLPEGGPHHAAAACSVPAVVIFGGYIAVETTGYEMHRNLGVKVGEACGNRRPCKHCADVMAAITPEQVATEFTELMRKCPAYHSV
jgi:ADP-heptose:LPS heptosyltransferase